MQVPFISCIHSKNVYPISNVDSENSFKIYLPYSVTYCRCCLDKLKIHIRQEGLYAAQAEYERVWLATYKVNVWVPFTSTEVTDPP